jgi:hypothetical protein
MCKLGGSSGAGKVASTREDVTLSLLVRLDMECFLNCVDVIFYFFIWFLCVNIKNKNI